MDAREELLRMRRLAELEAKMAEGEPSFGEKLGTNLFTGSQKLGAGLANLPIILGRGVNAGMEHLGFNPLPKDSFSAKMLEPNYFDSVLAQAEKQGKAEGFQSPSGRAAAEAIPGVFMTPGATVAAPARSLGLAMGPAVVGEKVGEQFGPLAGAGAAMLSGGLAGAALGPRQSVAKADIRRELAGLPPEGFDAARRNAADAIGAGSKTATAAEMFPGQGRILALAQKTAGQRGGEMLGNQLGGREGDIRQLAETFLNRLGPEVNTGQVANQGAEAAQGIYETAKKVRGDTVKQALAGQVLSPLDVNQINDSLLLAARNTNDKYAKAAYELVAERLVGADGQLLTNLQDLSFAIKRLKGELKNPNSFSTSGKNISDGDVRNAVNLAEKALKRVSPTFDKAMQFYGDYTRDTLRPLRQGPVGTVSPRNPVNAGQQPITRFQNVMDNETPTSMGQFIDDLGNPAVTGGQTASAQDIARALYQQKLKGGSQTPGKTVRGEPGSHNDRMLETLTTKAGLDPVHVSQPLRVAENLTLKPPGSVNGLPEMLMRQAAFRPFRTFDMMMTAKSQRDINRELARLLAGPLDPKQINELQKIAMFDPNVRRMLTLRAAGQPLIPQGE